LLYASSVPSGKYTPLGQPRTCLPSTVRVVGAGATSVVPVGAAAVADDAAVDDTAADDAAADVMGAEGDELAPAALSALDAPPDDVVVTCSVELAQPVRARLAAAATASR